MALTYARNLKIITRNSFYRKLVCVCVCVCVCVLSFALRTPIVNKHVWQLFAIIPLILRVMFLEEKQQQQHESYLMMVFDRRIRTQPSRVECHLFLTGTTCNTLIIHLCLLSWFMHQRSEKNQWKNIQDEKSNNNKPDSKTRISRT